MAGGTWTAQNKRRPGAYINTKGVPQGKPDTSLGRLLLIGANELNWGANGVIELDAGSDYKALLGADLTDPKLAAFKEASKAAQTVLYLNSNDGVKAKVADDALPWVFTAKYAGTRGNDITISVEKDLNDETLVTVSTLFGTELVDQQNVRTTTASGLKSNAYVDVEYVGDDTKLTALAGATTYKLSGGTTVASDVTEKLNDVLSTEQYNVVSTAGIAPDSNLHALVATAVKRLRENEGYKVRAVVVAQEGGASFDYEGVTAVANGVELTDGTQLPATIAAGWFAGVSASASAGTSLTYAQYPDAVSAYPKLSNEVTINDLNAGLVVFSGRRDGTVVVEQDINSLVTYTDEKPAAFAKNRVIRALDAVATYSADLFESQYIGKVNNDATGRDLFKAALMSYLSGQVTAGVLLSYDADSLSVEAGNDKDSVVVNAAIMTVDAMEKLYMTINVA